MRNPLWLVVVGAAGCTAQASRSTWPVHYSCGDVAVTRDAAGLHFGDAVEAPAISPRWHDDSGDHFVTSSQAPGAAAAIEIVVPVDRRADAIQRTYDTSTGTSVAGWHLLERQVCTVHGGYTDALHRFATGASFDQLATDMSLTSRDEARRLVRRAISNIQRRYAAAR